jgi:hypothetical protein
MAAQTYMFMGQEWSSCLIRHIAGLCIGRTLQEIADDLGLTYNTVRTYNTRVADRMGVSLRPQITALAYANKFDTLGNYDNEYVYIRPERPERTQDAPASEGPVPE